MNNVAMWFGYAAMVSGGFLVIAMIVGSAAYAVNVSCRKALKSYGGWKVFNEFVEWSRATRSNRGGE